MLASRIQAYCQHHIHLVPGQYNCAWWGNWSIGLPVDYQLGSYFKPSHLSLEKFRRKLSYKLKPIINFGALFMYHEWSLLSHVIVGCFLSKEAIDNAYKIQNQAKPIIKKWKKLLHRKTIMWMAYSYVS